MKKILLINPWGIKNDEFYTNGLATALSKIYIVDLATNFYYEGAKPSGSLYGFFFKKSERIHNNTLFRKLLRGIEYIVGCINVIRLIKKEKYDYVHILWLLSYKLDPIFLTMIKKQNLKIVYTAHNVIPHVNGKRHLNELRKIYDLVDIIIVHGEAIKNEFLSFFPDCKTEIIVQPHGALLSKKNVKNDCNIPKDISTKIQGRELYIMFGNQFYNKGTDRLIKIWRAHYLNDKNRLLVIAGRRTNAYPELVEELNKISDYDNILILSGYIDEALLDYLIQHSEAILLPYRHASMSGVIFTAAEYQRMVLTTRSGAIQEYLEDGEDSIAVDNTDDCFFEGMNKLMALTHNEKMNCGKKLYKNINSKYSWDSIAKLLSEKVYIK